jgi:predicted TIM-barrel fold metal-dependent hydrolase
MNHITPDPEAVAKARALPEALKPLAGRMMDIDSHEMMPVVEWVKRLGGEMDAMANYYAKYDDTEDIDRNSSNIPDYPGDILPIDDNIVNIKGPRAPGAVDAERRIDVMDIMGVKRQLVFPTNPAVFLMWLYKDAADPNYMPFVKGDRLAVAKRWIDLVNEWLMSRNAISDRVRHVPVLYGDTPEELIARARYFLHKGIRAMWLFPAGELPGGKSPAHPDLDPLWALLSETNCPLMMHVAGDGHFLKTDAWQDAPVFAGHVRHVEVSRSPWFLAQMHLSFENFLSVMLLGGVFDRHPMLRFGIAECTAYWVGPLVERLDLWHRLAVNFDDQKRTKVYNPTYHLPKPPSFYLKRNVRVTPFHFEDGFVKDIERYGLEDVFCFSTDYPHVEGGRNAANTFYNKLAPLGDEAVEKFFVRNGEWLLPD